MSQKRCGGRQLLVKSIDTTKSAIDFLGVFPLHASIRSVYFMSNVNFHSILFLPVFTVEFFTSICFLLACTKLKLSFIKF